MEPTHLPNTTVAAARPNTTLAATRPFGPTLTNFTEWEEQLDVSGRMVAARCINTTEPSPSTAFCIAGPARGFISPLSQALFRHNFFQAFAGDPATSRAFLLLKAIDSAKPGHNGGASFKAHKEITAAELEQQLATPWLNTIIGSALIIDGHGSYQQSAGEELPPLGPAHHPVRTVTSNETAWGEFRMTGCKDGCCPPANEYLKNEYEKRLLLQHLGINWCGTEIIRYEEAAGRVFDVVIYARPDLLWFTPIAPWCAWPSRQRMLTCGALPGCDMAWVAPRKYLTVLSNQHKLHRDCTHYESRRLNCCTSGEYLLRAASRGISDAGRLGSMLQPSSKGVSVLRFVDGVCDYVLHPIFDTSIGHPQRRSAGALAMSWMNYKGFDVTLLQRMRFLFVGNERYAPAGFKRSPEMIQGEARLCAQVLRDQACVLAKRPILRNGVLMATRSDGQNTSSVLHHNLAS